MDILHSQLAAVQKQLSWVQTEPLDWRLYVQVFSWTVTLFESYLLLRQYPLYSKTSPPPALANDFEPGQFEKSQAYGKDKAKFALFSGLYKQLLDSTLLQIGFYAWSWDAAGRLLGWAGYGSEYQITQSIAFVFLLYFLSTIPTLPLSVYSTFVLEEKHGFNKTTPQLFAMDMIKSWGLALAFGAPFLAVFLKTFEWAGDRFVPWVMAFMITFQLTMVILYPTIIQPLFNTLSPLPPTAPLTKRINTLASLLRFPLKHLYSIDGSKRSSHSNAYFFGLPWAKHIVIFDTLIAQSKEEEVEAVLAHELGHWYWMHPSKMLVVSQVHVFGILALFPAFLRAPPVLRSFGFGEGVVKASPTIVAFLLFQMILTPIEAVVSIGMNAMSRRFEYEADRFAVELQDRVRLTLSLHTQEENKKVDDGKDRVELEKAVEEMGDMGDRLGRALVSLHVKNLSTVWVDWMYSAYHHSHPTLTERLRGLEEWKAGVEAKRRKKE